MVEKQEIKRIDRDDEVEITSNFHGFFTYSNRDVYLELDEYGDSEIVTFKELKSMASGRSKAVLHNFYVIVGEAYYAGFSQDEVVKQLRIDKYYDRAKELMELDEVTVDGIENFVIKSSVPELEEAIKEDNLREMLLQHLISLYRKRKIPSDKLQRGLQIAGVEDFYSYLSDLED